MPEPLTATERERVLQAFEAHLATVSRAQYDVERMRWECKITDQHGTVFVVAEYRLGQDGSVTRLWVLPEALWPCPPPGVARG